MVQAAVPVVALDKEGLAPVAKKDGVGMHQGAVCAHHVQLRGFSSLRSQGRELGGEDRALGALLHQLRGQHRAGAPMAHQVRCQVR